MAEVLALKVMSKRDKKPMDIKPDRFNPEHHEKIPGESPRMIQIDGTPVTERIVIDPVKAAVEDGERKAKEAAAAATKSVPTEPVKEPAQEPTDSDGEPAKKESPYATLLLADLRIVAKEKGLTVPNKMTKQEILDLLAKSENNEAIKN